MNSLLVGFQCYFKISRYYCWYTNKFEVERVKIKIKKEFDSKNLELLKWF